MTLNGVERGLLLKEPLISSIERTLFPIDSSKSDNILLANIILSEITPEGVLIEFSFTKSKSLTQFKSTWPTRSLTIFKYVVSVLKPTDIGLSWVDSSWKSENFLYPNVWFNVLTTSSQSSKATLDFNEYEKFW